MFCIQHYFSLLCIKTTVLMPIHLKGFSSNEMILFLLTIFSYFHHYSAKPVALKHLYKSKTSSATLQ